MIDEKNVSKVLHICRHFTAALHEVEADDDIVGMALADLVSIWVVGHMVRGNKEKTEQFRAEVFDGFIKLVRDLTPENAQGIEEMVAGGFEPPATKQ